tara:strand:+ start:123 stop:548 length:426 start_codon:yes stop_codon:yes gene_type:complete
MIVKTLRVKNNWSQEQLATLSGLSLRTIQRVEAGNKASLETLKSLASVFEINLLKLTEVITVLDKNTNEWTKVPSWVTWGVWGVRRRKAAIQFELSCFFIGVVGFIGSFFEPALVELVVFWGASYWYAASIRWLDNENIWE